MVGLQTQEKLFLTLSTGAGEDMLILNKFEGTEEISSLFEFKLETYSMTAKNATALTLDFSTVLKDKGEIAIHLGDKVRYFNGIITHITQGPTVASNTEDNSHEKTYFYLTLRPKMWLLTLRENCRIFQNKTTLEIIKEILKEHEIVLTDSTTKVGKDKREFCVQYNETDFAFVARLMEAAGIYYFFSHIKGTHTLILFDGSKPYTATVNAPTVKVVNPLLPGYLESGIRELNAHQQVISDKYTTKDFSYETPSTDLKAQAQGSTELLEVYQYPGKYKVQATGETISTRRLNAIESQESLLSGKSNVPFLMPGYSFKLLKAARTDLNNLEYVPLKITHYGEVKETAPEIQVSDDPLPVVDLENMDDTYYNTFTCFPKLVTYVPLLKTLVPRIYGTQTAIVTGKAQEEIWTDKYGRVLVKFHWDLSDTKNENTSCWVRVMQGWTGAKWGMLFIPRIGQEVVVTFLNGDPDTPLITGCVYNGDNLPPYLPGEPTKSTIKSNTSKGGDGYNEFRFEDKKDNEEIYIHAEKDLKIDVVKGNRTTTLEAKKNTSVTDTLKIVKGHRVKTLTEGNETVTLTKGNRAITLSQGNDTLTLSKGNRTTTLTQGNDTLTLSAGNQTVSIKGKRTEEISENYSLKVGGNLTIEVTGNITMKGQKISITCTQFDLQASASLSMKAATMAIKASATAEIAAGATMTVKGEAQATFQSSAMATLQGSAMASVKGGVVMIG